MLLKYTLKALGNVLIYLEHSPTPLECIPIFLECVLKLLGNVPLLLGLIYP